jgi:hypothetical protein
VFGECSDGTSANTEFGSRVDELQRKIEKQQRKIDNFPGVGSTPITPCPENSNFIGYLFSYTPINDKTVIYPGSDLVHVNLLRN